MLGCQWVSAIWSGETEGSGSCCTDMKWRDGSFRELLYRYEVERRKFQVAAVPIISGKTEVSGSCCTDVKWRDGSFRELLYRYEVERQKFQGAAVPIWSGETEVSGTTHRKTEGKVLNFVTRHNKNLHFNYVSIHIHTQTHIHTNIHTYSYLLPRALYSLRKLHCIRYIENRKLMTK